MNKKELDYICKEIKESRDRYVNDIIVQLTLKGQLNSKQDIEYVAKEVIKP